MSRNAYAMTTWIVLYETSPVAHVYSLGKIIESTKYDKYLIVLVPVLGGF
jgi:hypothetical protein